MTLLGLASCVFFLSWWMTGRLCQRTSKLFLLDHPNSRSLHERPTPRTGGVAIAGSLFLGLIVARFVGVWQVREEQGWLGWSQLESWILSMTMVLSIVSFWDDRAAVPVWVRLGCQFAIAAFLVLGVGLIFPTVSVPLVGTIELGWLRGPFTILFMVWLTNLYNFMDGMDGFAGGMTALGCGFLAYFAWQAGHDFILVSATFLSLASAGFLVHNFPPAKIFMGDVGSVSSGFLCSALIVLGCRDQMFDFWVPIILFSPFILDATATLVKRVWQREKVWLAHRTHYYQRLVLSGWGHRKTVLAEYSVMVVCGGIAVLYQSATEEWRLVILGFWGMLFLSLALMVRNVEKRLQVRRS